MHDWRACPPIKHTAAVRPYYKLHCAMLCLLNSAMFIFAIAMMSLSFFAKISCRHNSGVLIPVRAPSTCLIGNNRLTYAHSL